MTYDMMNSSCVVPSNMRSDYLDLSGNQGQPYPSFAKPVYSFTGRAPPTLSLAEQAELEFELRYRGNMIVDQQRKIQQLEEDLKQSREQMDMMTSQIAAFEQDKKKAQSRYWTPEEHQRFLEALAKYGHKDVKAISMHVSTRNATQVRTHAQKYFLRLERERRKKDDHSSTREVDGYTSADSIDDGDQTMLDEGLSAVSISSLTLPGSPAVSASGENTPSSPGTPTETSTPSSPIPTRVGRPRSTSLISTAQARLAVQHRDSVLAGLPSTWTVEDYDQFVKGLLALGDKQDDVISTCRAIREQYLSHHMPEEVEMCYRNLMKMMKNKNILLGSPKRRRTNSRPEPLVLPPGVSNAPLSALPGMSSSNGFPFRSHGHSQAPPSMLTHSYPGPAPSPLSTHVPLTPMSAMGGMRGSNAPFQDYSSSSLTGVELPLLSELSISGVNMNMNMGMVPQHHHHLGLPSHMPSPTSSPWGLPFSLDSLMSNGTISIPSQTVSVSRE